MICPKCGTENRNANALCFRCGAPLHAEAEPETLEDLEVENPDVETEEKPKKIGFFARLFGRWKKEDEYDEYDDFDFEGDAKEDDKPQTEPNVIPVAAPVSEDADTKEKPQEELPAEEPVGEELPEEELPEQEETEHPEEEEEPVSDEEASKAAGETETEDLSEDIPEEEEAEDLEDLPYVEDMQDWSSPDSETHTTADGFTTLIGMREDGETMPKKVYRRRMSMSYLHEENAEDVVKPLDEELHDDLPPVPQKEEEPRNPAGQDVAEPDKLDVEDLAHTAKYTKEELNPASAPAQESAAAEATPEEKETAETADEAQEQTVDHTGNTQKYVPIRRRRPEPSIFSMPLQPEMTEEQPKVADTSKRRMRSIINALEEEKAVRLESRENYEERLRTSPRMAQQETMQKRLQRLAHARRPVYDGEEKEQELTQTPEVPAETVRRSEPTYVRRRTYVRDENGGLAEENPVGNENYTYGRTGRDSLAGSVRESRNRERNGDNNGKETAERDTNRYAVNRAYARDAARRAGKENPESRRAQRSAVWDSNQVSRRTVERKKETPAEVKPDPVSAWNEMSTSTSRSSARRNAGRNTDMRNDTGIAQLSRKKQRRRRKFKNPRKAILILAAAAILLVAVLAGLFFGIRGIVRGIEQSMDAKKQAQIDAMKPTIEETTLNGKPAHKLTFTGSQGELIYITELKRTFPVSDGKAVVTLDDSQWISNVSSVGSVVEVTLNPILYSSSGKQTVMPPVVFSVNVPVAPLTILAPKDGRVEINSSLYEIQIQVIPGSKVSIGGQDVSDLQDGNGNISYNVQVEAVGDNPIAIEVSANGYTTNHASVIIHRPFMTIPTEFKNTDGEIVKEKSVTLTGKTEPGVQLSLDSHPDVQVTLNENGEFSFKADFTKYGENTFTLRVKKEGVEDTVISTTVYYSPSADVYTRTAYKLDYDTLADGVGKLRCYEVKGTITEIVKNDDPFTFLVNVGTEDAPKIIRIEMVSKTTYPQQGNKYRIFADMKEMGTDGIPVMIGRFWYDPE
ncbi:MAG: hypothetical protein II781_02840 [Clostridia bacterium]|nr:hypothetical protein [Clostridia bacterium]